MSERMILAALAVALAACAPPHDDPAVAPPTPADEVELLPPPTVPVTWDSWAGAFVRDYCVACHSPTATCGGSGCHEAGDPLLVDYRDQRAFTAKSAVIRCGISATQLSGCGNGKAKTYPKWNGQNPLPTDEERALIVQWIDAGAP